MSAIHFQPLSIVPRMEALTRYEAVDYSLVVGPGGKIPPALHRLSVDSLTFSFTPDRHILVGLDAYINLATCEPQTLVAPSVDQESAVVCTEPFDEHGIAQGRSNTVHYTYSDEQALLFIQVGRGQAITRIRCLSCVICGLGSNHELIEIWIEGVNP
jgi:hypothetical protein